VLLLTTHSLLCLRQVVQAPEEAAENCDERLLTPHKKAKAWEKIRSVKRLFGSWDAII